MSLKYEEVSFGATGHKEYLFTDCQVKGTFSKFNFSNEAFIDSLPEEGTDEIEHLIEKVSEYYLVYSTPEMIKEQWDMLCLILPFWNYD